MSRIKRGRRIGALLAALAVCCYLAAPGVRAQEDLLSPDEVAPQEYNYKTGTVERTTLVREQQGSGTIYYPKLYQVKNEQAGATLVEYKVKARDQVKAGDVLVVLSIEGVDIRVQEAQRAVERIQRETAQGVAEREDRLEDARETLAESSGYGWELQNIEVQRQETELERYRTQQAYALSLQQKELEKAQKAQAGTELKAPVDGEIISVASDLRSGDSVDAGKVLVYMHALDVAVITVDNSYHTLRYNMEVTVDDPRSILREGLTGRVVATDDMVPDETTTSNVAVVELEDPEIVLEFSDVWQVSANTAYLENVLMVPSNAITLEDGRTYVTKLKDNMLQKRRVITGMNTKDGTWILQGVSEGDVLVLE